MSWKSSRALPPGRRASVLCPSRTRTHGLTTLFGLAAVALVVAVTAVAVAVAYPLATAGAVTLLAVGLWSGRSLDRTRRPPGGDRDGSGDGRRRVCRPGTGDCVDR